MCLSVGADMPFASSLVTRCKSVRSWDIYPILIVHDLYKVASCSDSILSLTSTLSGGSRTNGVVTALLTPKAFTTMSTWRGSAS